LRGTTWSSAAQGFDVTRPPTTLTAYPFGYTVDGTSKTVGGVLGGVGFPSGPSVDQVKFKTCVEDE